MLVAALPIQPDPVEGYIIVAGLNGDLLSPGTDQTAFLELDDYFRALERAHGPLARRVAENLVAPRERVVCETILRDAAMRQHLGRRGGGRDQPIRITSRHVRQAFGLSPRQWRYVVHDIRSFTTRWLTEAAE